MQSQTQWRTVATADGLLWMGLDYVGVEQVMRRTVRVAADGMDEVFAQVQILERAAREIWNQPLTA